MYRRLRLRLTLVCSSAVCLILALMTAGALHYAEEQMDLRAWEPFTASSASAVSVLAGGGVLDYAWLSRAEADGSMMIYVESGAKPILYTFLRGERAQLFEQARLDALREYGFDMRQAPQNPLAAEQVTFELRASDGVWYYAQVAKIPAGKGWLGYCALKSQTDDRMRVVRLRGRFALLVGLATLALFAFSYFFTARALRPVEQNQKRQTEFVWAASHELRSPLAVIRAGLDTVNKDPDETRRLAPMMCGECERMARLVDDMLSLARADSRTWTLRVEEAQVETLVLCAAETFEAPARKKSVTLGVTLPDGVLIPCRCDPQRIAQVLAVLLDNALCYTPPGGSVTLSAARRRGGAEIRVADSGPGVADAFKERVFERFFCADASRSGKEHFGLGLSIAAEIAALHRGTLRVTDTPGGGATFILWIPSNKQAPPLN